MSPEENFKFLNSYLERVGPVIRKHNGFIDKYIGDAIMALFPNKVDDAINCAIEMQRVIENYNEERILWNKAPIIAGIGQTAHAKPIKKRTILVRFSLNYN